jgi:hypothetical protein
MQRVVHFTFLTILAVLGLQGCSGPQEDPRVSFCRGLAADLVGGDVSAWSHADNRIVEPEYARVKVQSGGETVSCWYAYTAVEPGAMEHANPLLAYDTVPYQVKAGGKVLKGPALAEAVKRQQVEFGRAVVEHAKQGVNDAVQEVKDAVGAAGRQ